MSTTFLFYFSSYLHLVSLVTRLSQSGKRVVWTHRETVTGLAIHVHLQSVARVTGTGSILSGITGRASGRLNV
jgi:hypothetical protein